MKIVEKRGKNMQNTLASRKTSIIITLFLLLLLSLINFINNLYRINFDSVHFWYRSFLLLLAINCVILIKDLNIKKLTCGFIIYTVTSILHLIEVFKIFPNTFSDYIYVGLIFGLILNLLGTFDLLKHRNEYDKRLQKLVFYDSLTNLPNRNYLMRSCPLKVNKNCDNCEYCSIDRIINTSERSAFLFLDIDDFKLVNDFLGHLNGDLLLQELSKRINSCVVHDDLVIHLSGDEFVIIINNIDYKEDIATLTNQIILKINEPILLDEKEVNVSCSIGIALYPEHGTTIEKLMKRSDLALNKAKSEGKNKYYFYTKGLNDSFYNRYLIIEDLKHGIKNGELIVYYQPKANTQTNEIIGLEALVRWNHPKHGLIYPNDFIPLAEEIRVIDEIDRQVLKFACKQISDWVEAGKEPYNIAVNISPLFFMDNNFISIIDCITSEFKIDPSYISIEITETVALENIDKTNKKLKELKQRNIKTYIDDFGKGYSSISYIKDFEFDFLKIDKKFIDGIKVNAVDEAIIKYIIDITGLVDIKVISEGVETKEQLEFLKDSGCFGYQGYLLSKPQPLDQLNLK
jgi:diguanylate cyclase (GGDEF)-like protein